MAVLKVIEVLSSSEKSWEDAAANAVKIASKTVKEIRSVYVQDMSAVVTKNNITEFRVTVKITFEVMAGWLLKIISSVNGWKKKQIEQHK